VLSWWRVRRHVVCHGPHATANLVGFGRNANDLRRASDSLRLLMEEGDVYTVSETRRLGLPSLGLANSPNGMRAIKVERRYGPKRAAIVAGRGAHLHANCSFSEPMQRSNKIDLNFVRFF
jgi:hypothetical protein